MGTTTMTSELLYRWPSVDVTYLLNIFNTDCPYHTAEWTVVETVQSCALLLLRTLAYTRRSNYGFLSKIHFHWFSHMPTVGMWRPLAPALAACLVSRNMSFAVYHSHSILIPLLCSANTSSSAKSSSTDTHCDIPTTLIIISPTHAHGG